MGERRSRSTAVRRLLELGCDLGMSHELSPGETGSIYLSSGIGGWSIAISSSKQSSEKATKPDNLAKLKEPPSARRRHLGVIIDSSTGATLSAASHGSVGRAPALPPPITTAWVFANSTAYSLAPPEPCQAHEVPEEVFSHRERWIDED